MAKQKTVKETNNPHNEIYENMPQHAHWSTYDMSLEGCRYNILDGLVAATPFHAIAAAAILSELDALGQSKGYGDEDSYLCDTGSFSDEEIEADPRKVAEREMHQDDPDAQFTEEVTKSVSILRKAAATPEAAAFVATIYDTVATARVRGAEMRRKRDTSVPSGPGGP